MEFLQSNTTALVWLGGFSLVSFLVTLIAVPWVIINLPDNYFSTSRRSSYLTRNFHPWLAFLLIIMKNFLALIIVLAGIIMLVVPGQGILTILIGVMMLDFPGKYAVERWIVCNRSVLASINWLRQRKGKNELQIPKT